MGHGTGISPTTKQVGAVHGPPYPRGERTMLFALGSRGGRELSADIPARGASCPLSQHPHPGPKCLCFDTRGEVFIN